MMLCADEWNNMIDHRFSMAAPDKIAGLDMPCDGDHDGILANTSGNAEVQWPGKPITPGISWSLHGPGFTAASRRVDNAGSDDHNGPQETGACAESEAMLSAHS